MIIQDCPRCGATKMTFDVQSIVTLPRTIGNPMREIFCQCRACHKTTVFVCRGRNSIGELVLDQFSTLGAGGLINENIAFLGYVNSSDLAVTSAPDSVPRDVSQAFQEGAKCVKAGCPNAAAAMFRLALDLATEPLLPADGEPAHKIRRDLGKRLPWLFDNGRLPTELRALSDCVREDGNDGAHRGSLTAADAQDLEDFAVALLERLFTEPARLAEAATRRAARRQPQPGKPA